MGHPFWDATLADFVDAIDLRVGDEVLAADGRLLSVESSRVYSESLMAYNLEVSGIHTYYAGETPVLVHNSCELPLPTILTEGKLPNLVADFYKGVTNKLRVGTGTTADAIRNELATGLATADKFHSIKGQDMINGFGN